jgi:hypothetical protein
MSDKTTRDHIVEAADRLFYEQGYEHTSFSDALTPLGSHVATSTITSSRRMRC